MYCIDDPQFGPRREERLIEVRCCCQPDKMLGWLPAPSYMFDKYVMYRVRAPVIAQNFTHTSVESLKPVHMKIIELEIEGWQKAIDTIHYSGLAYKADGQIDEIKKIPGFIEYREPGNAGTPS